MIGPGNNLEAVAAYKAGALNTGWSSGAAQEFLFAERAAINAVEGFGQVVCTRASDTATRINALGFREIVGANVPRLNFDPVTLACRGLLVESSRTNLLLRSREFDNGVWTKANATVTPDATTGTDNTSSGDMLVESVAGGLSVLHYTQQGPVTTAASTTYTASVRAKAGTRTKFVLLVFFGSLIYERGFDLSNGTSFASDVGVTPATGYTITPDVGGWYTCTMTQTTNATTNCYVRCLLNNGTTTNYIGDGTSGMYLTDAQLEEGAFATSPIPTTSAAVTRNADEITADGFSVWGNATEGTILCEFDGPGISTDPNLRIVWSLGDNTSSAESMFLAREASSTAITVNVIDGGVSQIAAGSAGTLGSSTVKTAFAYAANDFAWSTNGGSVSTDGAGSLPTVTVARLGKSAWPGGGYLNGHIRRWAFLRTREPNAYLQALTA